MDKMSSAHVYLRMRKGQTIDDISEGLLEDCAQLVKANSIQGKSIYIYEYIYQFLLYDTTVKSCFYTRYIRVLLLIILRLYDDSKSSINKFLPCY